MLVAVSGLVNSCSFVHLCSISNIYCCSCLILIYHILELSHILDHDNYFINKKMQVFFIIELKHRETTVFAQGRPQLAGE